ncbi:MAG: hypothetical protein J3R72DRAFT_442264, partial [Linnemannia gamsii]
MDRPAFSQGGYGAPQQQPPLTPLQQQQHSQSGESAGHSPDGLHAAMHMALGPIIQQNKGISIVDITSFMDHLEMLMKDCSQANIQAGKNWVVHFCQNPQQYDVLMRSIVNIAISRKTFDEKLHIVYLANDILSHCERKQQQWIKEAIHPHLVPMLRAAYFFPGIDEGQRQRVIKVLDIWRNREFFPPPMIDSMEMHVKRPPQLPNNGQGPTSPPLHEQWQAQGQQPPFHPPAHLHPQPTPQQFQYHQQQQHHQQQHFPQQQQFQQQYPHHQQQQFPGFPHHPQKQVQYPFIHHPLPHPQQMAHHPDNWTPQAPGPHSGYPPFQGNAPMPQHPPQHPPQGTPPQTFHHQPNPYPQTPPFQNHLQQPQLQQSSLQPQFPHAQRNTPVTAPAPAPVSVPPPPPPEPTHRDVLTRDLHAGQMISKVEDDADYYEPLPAYVSVPFKKKVHQDKDLLDSVAQFVLETNALKAEDLAKGDEGWHEGKLDVFFKKH